MNDLKILAMAKGLAHHASTRQNLIAENVANADSVGFRARGLPEFADVYRAVETNARPDRSPVMDVFTPSASRPGHVGYNPDGTRPQPARPYEAEPQVLSRLGAESASGNSVSLEDQMARGAVAAADHMMAISILKKSMDLLRMSIGRR